MAEYEGKGSVGFGKNFQGPECLSENCLRISAGMIYNEEDWRVLRIMSGGGMQDWGVVIGPEKMEVPPTENFKYHERASEYRLKLADGAYVWYEFQ